MNSTVKNIIYMVLQQFILLFLPLLTIPYVSRILGPSEIGIVSYSNSIVMLFINFALLGSEYYGVREIAKVKDDRVKLTHMFSEIFTVRLTFLTGSLLIYLILSYVYFDSKLVFYLQCINLLAYMVDINWFFQGMEQFKKILIRNIIIKLIGFISVFIFIKDESDIYIYIIILALTTFLGNIFLLFNLPKFIDSVKKTSVAKSLFHVRNMLSLFMAGFSIMIYILIDKIMLGMLSTTAEVGYYEQGQRIINVAVNVVAAFNVVMLPKATQLINEKDNKSLVALLNTSILNIAFIVLPIFTTFFVVSSDFITWFLGDQFQRSVFVGQVLAPLILIKAIGIMFGAVYFIPLEKNKEYTLPLVVGAIVNIVLNVVLIPGFGSKGSAFATLLTELIILLIQLYYLRKIIKVKQLVQDGILKYIGSSAIIMISLIELQKVWSFTSKFENILIYSVISVVLYIILLVLFRDKILNTFINKFLKNRVHKVYNQLFHRGSMK
ncbi:MULTISPECIES: oligosaccharide flippase family protein [Priestia]|uniref:oligosaccharide flippase family protein n=1 Tax=Priestia TaxID=2800373 RepID=UPI001C8D3DA8|nr:oligosaccharide flippase family protein [Priestia aryabhattai]MBY0213505.1 polysaccharide biosynthesis protein [Priestia aryabhattai]MDT0148379.1 oligosaccharide flippase family protein [Priestia aryabhattai]MDT0153755.1 oligosaccharide flippase family protein [Priestia aryabhattai]